MPRRSVSESQRRPVSDSRLEANRRNARKSTGPRTLAGKVRSGRNAWRHGHYCGSGGYGRLVEASMQELGEDAGEFSRLEQSLFEEWRPRSATASLLVADLASLRWERQRLERARAALTARRVQQLELKHQRASLEVERQTTARMPAEALRVGMLWMRDCATKYQKLLEWLDALKQQLDLGLFEGADTTIECVYGKLLTPRGALISTLFLELAKERAIAEGRPVPGTEPEEAADDDDDEDADDASEADEYEGEDEDEEDEDELSQQDEEEEPIETGGADAAPFAVSAGRGLESREAANPAPPPQPYVPNPGLVARLRRELEAEICNITQSYHLYIREHVEVTPVMRGECLAPTAEQRWLMRELNMVDRQIEKKTRLLWALQDRELAQDPPQGRNGARPTRGAPRGGNSGRGSQGQPHRKPRGQSPGAGTLRAAANAGWRAEERREDKRLLNGTNPISVENKGTPEERTQTKPNSRLGSTWLNPCFSDYCVSFSGLSTAFHNCGAASALPPHPAFGHPLPRGERAAIISGKSTLSLRERGDRGEAVLPVAVGEDSIAARVRQRNSDRPYLSLQTAHSAMDRSPSGVASASFGLRGPGEAVSPCTVPQSGIPLVSDLAPHGVAHTWRSPPCMRGASVAHIAKSSTCAPPGL